MVVNGLSSSGLSSYSLFLMACYKKSYQLIRYNTYKQVRQGKDMNKNNHFSYQGFRRKNSTNSSQLHKNASSTELSYLKYKHNQHLTEVQNLSMQLDSLTKRSISSRSLCEEKPKLYHSAATFPSVQGEVTQNELYNPLFKEEAPQQQIQMPFNFQKQARGRSDKVSTSLVFNKFQTIEEDHYTNEQQLDNAEVMESLPYKSKASQKIGSEKGILKLGQTKTVVHLGPKKPIQKIDLTGVNKRQKIKLQLNELDKMQKELDTKRSSRENNQAKPSNNLNALKKVRQPNAPNFKDSSKLVKSTIPQSQIKHLYTHSKSPKTTMTAQVKEQCIPTRMLSEKQKASLMMGVDSLREIIEKNDICSQSLQEILTYFNRIEKLLTK